jgi:dipeptidyl-peptidase-4
MRCTIFFVFLGLSLGPARSLAQPKPLAKDVPLDTEFLRTYAATRGFMLGRPLRPTPTPDGKAVLFLRSQPRVAKLRLYEFDVASGQTRELLTPEQVLKGVEEKLSPEEKARRERMRVSVGGFTSFQLSYDGRLVLLSLSGRLYTLDRAGGAIRELPLSGGTILDPKFSPDGSMVSFVRDHDVYVLDLAHGEECRVTTGGTRDITHGLAEFVAQEEMGRFSGYWWSPDSKFIVYQEADARGVEEWFVADPIHPGQKPHSSFYPRPGKANVAVRLGVTPIKPARSVGQAFKPDGPLPNRTGSRVRKPDLRKARAREETAWVQWDVKAYPYLTLVKWPEGGPLLVGVQDRDQREWVILQVDPKTGKTRSLVRERDPAWVNLRRDVPRWLPDNKGFLWVSERDGGPQLELRSANGRFSRILVSAFEGFQNIVDVDPKSGHVVYSASRDPTQSHLFVAPLGPWAEPVGLTKIPGQHSAIFAKNHKLYVHTARLEHTMPRSTVHRFDAKQTMVGELPSAAEEPGFEPCVEMLQVGDKGYYAALIRPRKFNAGKRYPVIVDVYGGPHHLHVATAKNRWLLDQWYADQGFIVVVIDGRGTPGRGRDWERAIFQKFGSVPLDDQVAGLAALGKQFPFMDMKRVGISGWSFGGYLSALAVLRRPDVFRAGVAGAPVVDWLDYDTHYTERYLGIPPRDEAAYKEGSLLTYAVDLRRPLLLLHGTADDNVYFRHSLKLVDALFRAGKPFEMLPLSGLTHMVPDPVVMERLHSRIAGFFQTYLGKPTE